MDEKWIKRDKIIKDETNKHNEKSERKKGWYEGWSGWRQEAAMGAVIFWHDSVLANSKDEQRREVSQSPVWVLLWNEKWKKGFILV